ncbi:hypothetical protein [Pseudomonas sp. TMB3-21]
MSDYSKLKQLAENYLRLIDDEDSDSWMEASDAYDDASGADTVLALIAENETLTKIFADAPNLPDTDVEWLEKTRALEVERDHLKAEVAGLKTGYEAYEQVVQGLKAENEVLRKLVPSKEIIWCACGDGHAANSYGAGFMDANNGVCANCDAAMSKEPSHG